MRCVVPRLCNNIVCNEDMLKHSCAFESGGHQS
jgi:hypothetical protein